MVTPSVRAAPSAAPRVPRLRISRAILGDLSAVQNRKRDLAARPDPHYTRPVQPSVPPNVRVVEPVPYRVSPRDRVRSFLKLHGRKLWWLHSAYALGLGITVVTFAQKGFDHARWLAASASAAWLLVLLFFRVFGSGKAQTHEHAAPKVKLR